MAKSYLEAKAELLLRAALQTTLVYDELKAEYKFHPTRQWRFDFAFPHHKIAIELEGGIWTGGRHTRGKGFESDCEKYNEAAKAGWLVLRYPSRNLGHLIEDVKHAFKHHVNWRVKVEDMLKKELALWEVPLPTEYEKGGAKAIRGLKNWLENVNNELGRD